MHNNRKRTTYNYCSLWQPDCLIYSSLYFAEDVNRKGDMISNSMFCKINDQYFFAKSLIALAQPDMCCICNVVPLVVEHSKILNAFAATNAAELCIDLLRYHLIMSSRGNCPTIPYIY